MTLEELAGTIGLRVGGYFVASGRLYRISRFTKLQIHVEKVEDSLPSDTPPLGISGYGSKQYLEVRQWVVDSAPDGKFAKDWLAKMQERTIILPDTENEAEMRRRVDEMRKLTAPINAEIAAEVDRHDSALRIARAKRYHAVRSALTSPKPDGEC